MRKGDKCKKCNGAGEYKQGGTGYNNELTFNHRPCEVCDGKGYLPLDTSDYDDVALF